MPADRSTPDLPPCYAMVHEGLEDIAADEIAQSLRGKVKRSGGGIIVFRLNDIGRDILHLRTTEDVFLYGWGTDELSYRAKDLESIEKWTDRSVRWDELLRIHHAITPKPKGKPTIHIVTQMTGVHGYRRVDAKKALMRGLAGKLPASWKYAEENASVEIWLTINEATAVCGMRLSDRTMRHRTYKYEHLPASIRPTIAAAMARLADLKPNQTVLDPMCGAGTLLAEAYLYTRGRKTSEGAAWPMRFVGGDIDRAHVRATQANLRAIAGMNVDVREWDARELPLDDASVERIVCNPPFGKQLSTPEEIVPLYRESVREMDRVLKPGGKAVLIAADAAAMRAATERVGWKQQRHVPLRMLGQRAFIGVYVSPLAA